MIGRWLVAATALILLSNPVHAQQTGAADPPKRFAMAPADFERYTGFYQLGPRTVLRLMREGPRFYMTPVGSTQKRELFAESAERFSADDLPLTIRFASGAEPVTEAIINQAGRDITAPRISEQAATALLAAAARPAPVATRTWATKIAPPRRITELTGSTMDYWPSFSADGQSIYFSRTPDGGRSWSLYRMPAIGGTVQSVFDRPGVAATRASVSRTGQIAFNVGNEIWTLDDGVGDARTVALQGIIAPAYPSWYPDGRHFAFVDGARNILYRADRTQGAATAVSRQSEVLAGMVSVSPDGKWIAFAGQKNSGQLYNQNDNQIWLLDESGAARPLESNPGPGRTPSWSPDGLRIAFESSRGSPDGHYAVFIVHRDGSGLVQVTDYALNGNHPSWSPDGKHLVFSWGSEPGKPNGIAVIEVPSE
jgi:dipeptidyl aminopeptidase/acylaminoacyl peptidase